MAALVYVLCAFTSLLCAGLLLRSYRHSGSRLLFWSSLCFVGLALNNVLLFVDLVLVPTMDMSVLRGTVALASLLVLLYGLIWET